MRGTNPRPVSSHSGVARSTWFTSDIRALSLRVGSLLAIVLLGCAPVSDARTEVSTPEARVTLPDPAWPRAERLRAIEERADSLEPLTSLLISFQDSTVMETYRRGSTRASRVNIKSASKSIISTLIGIAIYQGVLSGAEQPLEELLPGAFDQLGFADDPHRSRMTLHHLLSMTTGLEGTSFRNYGSWVASRNWVRSALQMPVTCEPGACMTYSTGNSHIASAILTEKTGMSTLAYARKVLFDPLGIPLPAWDRDPQGIYLGGNNMSLRPIDLLAFGRLYEHAGVHEGVQIVPGEWIDVSWGRYARSRWNGHHYGYFWWSREAAGETVHFAWGYGGQFVFVVPRLDLVVVATSTLDRRGRDGNHNADVHDLMASTIIPAFRAE